MTEPLRIALVMQGGRDWMGGREYVKNLAASLHSGRGEQASPFSVRLLSGQRLSDGVRAQFAPFVDGIDDGFMEPPVSAVPRLRFLVQHSLLKRPAALRAVLRAHPADFLYPLTYGNQDIGLFFPIGRALAPSRWAGWIPDFQHRHLPHFFNPELIAFRNSRIQALAAEAKTIVFSSQMAARDFGHFHPQTDADCRLLRFRTAPEAEWYGGDVREVRTRYQLPERFFLVSNQFWQHKNHGLVFEALRLLAQAPAASRPHLVCTGQLQEVRDESYVARLLDRMRQDGLASQISLLGLIPRADQIQLMRGALAVIQPSLFEGWSSVLEDARVLGKRVAVSDLPVHLEQDVPGARVFPRDSAAGLAGILGEWWKTLSPGPDPGEPDARRAAVGDLLAYGSDFLQIARTAR